MLRPFVAKYAGAAAGKLEAGVFDGATSRASSRPATTLGRLNAAIFLGALSPDLPLYLFFSWYTFIERASQRLLWSEYYFLPFWQRVFDLSHSFPLWGAGLAAGIWLKRRELYLFMAAGLMASVQDILLHHDDGHAHFFPLSDYRFASPVSYWDPSHYGAEFSLIEATAVTVAALWIFPRLQTRWGRALLTLGVISLWGTNALWSTLFSSL
jgi:hypothetical protein